MRRALVSEIPSRIGQKILLDEWEAKHITQVLRLRKGDTIEILDGRGRFAQARLGFQDRGVLAETLTEPTSDPARTALPITLYLSLIKGEAMEWVIEKSTELGVQSLIPIETDHSVVKVQKKGAEVFQERWQRIADQALKQCGRLDQMRIEPVMNLEQALQHYGQKHQVSPHPLYWADEQVASDRAGPNSAVPHLSQCLNPKASNTKSSTAAAYWVGPEGGWSGAERQRLLELTGSRIGAITRVHLGGILLRAETAAIFGVSLLVGNGKRENTV